MPTKPQDHKPKANAAFSFKGQDGKSYTLPKVSEDVASGIPGEITYAAVMEPNNGMAQMRLALATLEACKPTPAAMKALKAFPTAAMLEIVGEWMGESSGSSD